MEELLERIAYLEKEVLKYKYDDLTSLKLRKDFYEDIYKLYDEEDDFYLIMIDINGLHTINRTEGYASGDELIKNTSRIIKKYFKDNSYRIGGDEFVVFQKKVGIEHRNFLREIIKICTLSIVKRSSDCLCPDKLIDKADKIMIENKRVLYNNKDKRA